MKKRLHYIIIIACLVVPRWAHSQTLNDGLMMSKNAFCTGFMYTTDSWKNYWEGTLKRDNQNIGTLTTNSLMWYGNYGLSEKVNLIMMAPYVWTKATGGTLHPMQGVQDLTVGAKYRFFRHDFENGSFKTFAAVTASTPLTNYTPDFLPLSIGLASKTVSGKLSMNYSHASGFYGGASGSYVLRSNITLDRASYYSDGKLYLTNEVAMPNQFMFFANVGHIKNGLQIELNYSQQNTMGGGDIRKQDMPFASNQMNYAKGGILVMYYLRKMKNVALRGSSTYTIAGRNVGQSTAFMVGVLYTFHFNNNKI